MNKYLPRPKVAQGVNLLSGKNDAGEQRTQAEQAAAAAAPREIINFLKPNISISIVDDRTEYANGQIVPQVSHIAPDLAPVMYTGMFSYRTRCESDCVMVALASPSAPACEC